MDNAKQLGNRIVVGIGLSLLCALIGIMIYMCSLHGFPEGLLGGVIVFARYGGFLLLIPIVLPWAIKLGQFQKRTSEDTSDKRTN